MLGLLALRYRGQKKAVKIFAVIAYLYLQKTFLLYLKPLSVSLAFNFRQETACIVHVMIYDLL